MTRIVVLDGDTLNPGDLSWSELSDLGELEVFSNTETEEVIDRCRTARVVLTNKVELDAAVFDELPELELVSVLATGFDNVDVEAASARDVVVSNVPSYATDSVAQHTFALLLQLTNQVAEHDLAVRDDQWVESGGFTFWNNPLSELVGKTLGIVGYGRIGQRVASIAVAFGMNPIAYSPSLEVGTVYEDVRAVSFAELLETSNVISIHSALTDTNHHLFDAKAFEHMQDGCFLVNTARGALVDNEALAGALEAGRLRGAGLDVADGEPIGGDHPLLDAPNLIITPHNAWTSVESRRRLMATTVDNVEAFLRGEPINVVTAN